MGAQAHWGKIYTEKAPDAVSWCRPHLETPLELIEWVSGVVPARSSMSGGESTPVDDLLARGYEDVTVLDISRTAIHADRKRLGKASDRVHWLVADITQSDLPPATYDVWHDRAVFHFLIAPNDRVNRNTIVADPNILEQAGENRPKDQGLEPNARGRLLLEFVPATRYATVAAIEVVPD